ncbi:MAG: hypothetical protein ACRDLY_00520, partial [Thermoleophilaceae bacterium]
LKDLPDKDKEDYALSAAIGQFMKSEWDWAWWSGRCREEGLYVPADSGLSELLNRFDIAYIAYLRKAGEPAEDTTGTASGPGAAAIAAANKQQDKASAADKLEMKFGLDTIATALEREEALLEHLTRHPDYYRYVLFQALPPSEQLELLTKSGGLKAGLFEPHVVSMRGDFLAVPLLTALHAELDNLLTDLISGLSVIDPIKRQVSLPTPGISIESRLGKCSACGEFVEESRAIELRRLAALASQAEHEADRMAARLASAPPVLDDPNPAAEPLRVMIERPPSP